MVLIYDITQSNLMSCRLDTEPLQQTDKVPVAWATEFGLEHHPNQEMALGPNKTTVMALNKITQGYKLSSYRLSDFRR